MATDQSTPKGVLDDDYARNRVTKKELGFRFRVRAEAVAWAVQEFGPKQPADGFEVLDMGAAEGRTIAYMCEIMKVKHALGIEYNQDLIDMAEEMPQQVELREGDVTKIEGVEDHSVDVVAALALLEHLPDPSLAVAEAARVLRPGGVFVSSSPVPAWDHISTKLGLLAEDQHECDMHAKFFKSLIHDNADFELANFKKFMWAPVGFLPYLGIKPGPKTAFKWDRLIESLKLTNFMFVNQLCVAVRKPLA